MELLLIVQEQMSQFVRHREILAYRSMMRIDANDRLGRVAINKARYIVIQRLIENSGSLGFRNFLDRHRGFLDPVGRKQRLHQ